MKQVRVSIDGYGSFEVSIEFVAELMLWLNSKQAISLRQKNAVQETQNNQFTGRQLIEE